MRHLFACGLHHYETSVGGRIAWRHNKIAVREHAAAWLEEKEAARITSDMGTVCMRVSGKPKLVDVR